MSPRNKIIVMCNIVFVIAVKSCSTISRILQIWLRLAMVINVKQCKVKIVVPVCPSVYLSQKLAILLAACLATLLAGCLASLKWLLDWLALPPSLRWL